MDKLTHFDTHGNAIMVDVSEKKVSSRTAIAKGIIIVNDKIIDTILNNTNKKGDVLGIARVAGIMACKRTSDIIPLCHPLSLEKCTIDFEVDEQNKEIVSICTVTTSGKTGVEMETLTGVSASLLTIYDMCKAIDKGMIIKEICLQSKTGGKSGDFYR